MRVRLTVAYDGTGFHGFAAQDGVPTVGGALADAIGRVLRARVELSCAGRTDSGVHARGQVVSFDAPPEGLRVDLARLQRSVNGLCGPTIAVVEADVAPDDFDARFSARWRRYRYSILNRATPDPFLARTAWHVPDALDRRALQLAVDPFIGEHDFASFCRRPRTDAEVSLVRRVMDARWHAEGDVLGFEIRANAFCHQMVRSIVGLLVDVGVGRRRAGEVLAVLRARDRGAVGTVAPPHGLCLEEVGY